MDATMRPDQLIDSREGDPFAAWEGVSFFPFFGMMITMTILDPSVVYSLMIIIGCWRNGTSHRSEMYQQALCKQRKITRERPRS